MSALSSIEKEFLNAALNSDLKKIKKIVSSGLVSIDIVDENGFSALMIAVSQTDPQHHAVVAYLLSKNASTKVKSNIDEATALHYASAFGCHDCVSRLFYKDQSTIDFVTREGETALMWACMAVRFYIFKYISKMLTPCNRISRASGLQQLF